jgi:hypothetical protein
MIIRTTFGVLVAACACVGPSISFAEPPRGLSATEMDRVAAGAALASGVANAEGTLNFVQTETNAIGGRTALGNDEDGTPRGEAVSFAAGATSSALSDGPRDAASVAATNANTKNANTYGYSWDFNVLKLNMSSSWSYTQGNNNFGPLSLGP